MTKDEIKNVALSLFAKNGYEGTYLSDIAKGVGIKKPSIYNHFEGKEELFLAVFEDALWDHNKRIEALVEKIKNAPVEEKLYQILYDTVQFYLDNEEKTTFIKRSMIFPPEPLKEQLQEKFIHSEEALSAILREIFAEGLNNGVIREENMEDLLVAYYCLIDGLFIQLSYYGTEKVQPRVNNVWKSYWLGIKKQA